MRIYAIVKLRAIYLLIITCLVFISSCKKSAEIKVRVYNTKLHEFVPNAVVGLNELNWHTNRDPLLYGHKTYKSKLVAKATTDNQGWAIFNYNKLRNRDKFTYGVYTISSWDKSKESQNERGHEISKKSSEILIPDGYFTNDNSSLKIEYNDLFQNSVIGDSLIVTFFQINYNDIYSSTPYYTFNFQEIYGYNPSNGVPSSKFYSQPINDFGNFSVKIKKIKSGITSITNQTIKVYPQENKIISVNW